MDYFEEAVSDGDGVCSDNLCPCSPPTVISHGGGYLYIEQMIVDWRRQYPRLEHARRAMGEAMKRRLAEEHASLLEGGLDIVATLRTGPILVCEQGARLRKLDLKIAAADAERCWKTGQIPLRATPIMSSGYSSEGGLRPGLRPLLERLLGRERSRQDVMDPRTILAGHLGRLLDANPRWREAETMRCFVNSLLEGRCGEFTIAAAKEGVAESLAKKSHICHRGWFSDLYLSVSTIPAVEPSSMRTFFPGGYGAVMSDLLNVSGYHGGSVSLAHWVCGSDGSRNCAHLTLLPAMTLVGERASRVGAVIAKDLYTAQELAERGLM